MNDSWNLQPPSAESLFDRWIAAHAKERNSWVGLRLRRSTSWLSRAEAAMQDEPGDPDAAFIFLWIAFNALYAEHTSRFYDASEKGAAERFFGKVCRLDADRMIYNAIWSRFSGPIRMLLDNPYVYKRFWTDKDKPGAGDDWQARFAARRKRVHRALARQDTYAILCELFERLYVLRNQLVHGGATWNSTVNRDQVTDGRAIMATLVPHFLAIMIDNHEAGWGRPHFPPEFVSDG